MKTIALAMMMGCCAMAADVAEVKRGEMWVKPTFAATVLPEDVVSLKIEAEEWQDFSIEEIQPHGAQVKKGQVLVRFDDKNYQKKLRDAESASASAALQLQNAEVEYLTIKAMLPSQLQVAQQKAEHAAEALRYFEKTRRQAEIREADLSLRQTELRLESAREELVQLEKMYKADDLTENTEEIILRRQREMVKAYETTLELAKLSHRRKLDVALPREGVELKRAAESAEAEWKQTEQNLPRQVELKRMAYEEARVAQQRRTEAFERLQKEQSSFVIRATEDGWFYYGVMQEGRWSVSEAQKALAVDQSVAPNKVFACLVPQKSKLRLDASVDESTVRLLRIGQQGHALMTGAAEQVVPFRIREIARVPNADQRYAVVSEIISAETISSVVAGMTAKLQVNVYHQAKALLVSQKALRLNQDGAWELQCLQADQSIKSLVIKRGKTWGEQVEVLSGAEEGQKVLIPE